MRKVMFLLSLMFCSALVSGQSFNVMTYNLRYDNPNDGENNWKHRKEFILSQINYYNPSIFGTQEGLEHQLNWLDEKLESYSFLGIGRDEDGKGEFSALFYNADLFNVVESNSFWLSKTPSVPSKNWDASLNRICTYGLFKDKNLNTKFWVFNTHFDHKGIVARAKSVDVLLHFIDSLNTSNYPVVLMGDLNLSPDQDPIVKLSKEMNDSKMTSIAEPFGPDGTYCGFDISKANKKRIDYIFTSKDNIVVNSYAVFANVENMKYPSDHFPVMANISIKK